MMPVSTITQFEKELKQLQARERELLLKNKPDTEVSEQHTHPAIAEELQTQVTIHGLHDLKA